MATNITLNPSIVAQGNAWALQIATGSAFTYVAAWPTTRAELVLYNPASNTKSLIIDAAWMVDISSAAAAQSKALLGQLVPSASATAPTNDTAQLIVSLSGKTAYDGNATRAVAQTYATANKWQLLAATNNVQAASIGAGLTVQLNGQYIVPPGAEFLLAGVASTAAGTASIGVAWHELALSVN